MNEFRRNLHLCGLCVEFDVQGAVSGGPGVLLLAVMPEGGRRVCQGMMPALCVLAFMDGCPIAYQV